MTIHKSQKLLLAFRVATLAVAPDRNPDAGRGGRIFAWKILAIEKEELGGFRERREALESFFRVEEANTFQMRERSRCRDISRWRRRERMHGIQKPSGTRVVRATEPSASCTSVDRTNSISRSPC